MNTFHLKKVVIILYHLIISVVTCNEGHEETRTFSSCADTDKPTTVQLVEQSRLIRNHKSGCNTTEYPKSKYKSFHDQCSILSSTFCYCDLSECNLSPIIKISIVAEWTAALFMIAYYNKYS